MGLSKSAEFSKRLNKTAGLCHALGHPARVAILELLSVKSKLIAIDITSSLPLAQATVAQHLKMLVHSGLLQYRVEGSYAYYSIEKEAFSQLMHSLHALQLKLK